MGDRIAFNHAPSLHKGWRLGTVLRKNWGGDTYTTITVRWDPSTDPDRQWMNTDRYLTYTILTAMYHLDRGHIRRVVSE